MGTELVRFAPLAGYLRGMLETVAGPSILDAAEVRDELAAFA
jgi:hypothetical protein